MVQGTVALYKPAPQMGSPRDRAELGPQPGPWPAEAPHLFSVAVLPAGGEEAEVRAAAAAAKT